MVRYTLPSLCSRLQFRVWEACLLRNDDQKTKGDVCQLPVWDLGRKIRRQNRGSDSVNFKFSAFLNSCVTWTLKFKVTCHVAQLAGVR
jgi:hypothetical protein